MTASLIGAALLVCTAHAPDGSSSDYRLDIAQANVQLTGDGGQDHWLRRIHATEKSDILTAAGRDGPGEPMASVVVNASGRSLLTLRMPSGRALFYPGHCRPVG